MLMAKVSAVCSLSNQRYIFLLLGSNAGDSAQVVSKEFLKKRNKQHKQQQLPNYMGCGHFPDLQCNLCVCVCVERSCQTNPIVVGFWRLEGSTSASPGFCWSRQAPTLQHALNSQVAALEKFTNSITHTIP